jgi:cell division protein FtsB
MSSRRKKEKTFWQRILYSQLVIIVGIAFIVMFSVGISKRMVRQHQLNRETESLKHEIEKLERSNQELNELLSYLNSDNFLEDEARTKLGLKKEGEEIIIINDKYKTKELDKNTSGRIYQPSTSAPKSNPEKWWDYFFSIN